MGLYRDVESDLRDDVSDVFVGGLDGVPLPGVGVVVEERPQVQPPAPGFQDGPDGLDVLHHVAGRVHEEAGGHAVPRLCPTTHDKSRFKK